MKHVPILAAALLLGATAAVAQQPSEIPAHKCGTPPAVPGEKMMAERMVRNRFEREVKTYGERPEVPETVIRWKRLELPDEPAEAAS